MCFSLILLLLVFVTSVTLVANSVVQGTFETYDRSLTATQHVMSVAARTATLQLAIAQFIQTEAARDRTAVTVTLTELIGLLTDGSPADEPLLAGTTTEAQALPALLGRLFDAVFKLHDAGTALVDAANSSALTLAAIQARVGRDGLDPEAILRAQSAVQIGSLFAARYQLTRSPKDLNAAKAEIARLSVGVGEITALAQSIPRLERKLEVLQASVRLLEASVGNLQTGTTLREESVSEILGGLGRIREAVAATEDRLSAFRQVSAVKLRASLASSVRLSVATAVAAMVLAVLSGFALVRSCVRPLNALVQSLRDVSAGRLDSVVPYAARQDEIGDMGAAVLTLRDNAIRTRALEAQAAAATASLAGDRQLQASKNADETERALGEVAAEVGRTAEHLLRAAGKLGDIAGRTSVRAEIVVQTSQRSRVSAEQVLTAAHQLIASVEVIAGNVSSAARLTAGAAQDASRTEDVVRRLSAAAGGVQRASYLIATVAGRTKLLALNATIAAARAGDAGRGFQVVANEVKDLAMQTTVAAASIAGQMTSMIEATKGAIETITGIRSAIVSVDELTTQAVSTFDEQDATMRAIVTAAGGSFEAASDVAAAMHAVLTDTSEAAQSVGELRDAAVKVSAQGQLLDATLHQVVDALRAA